MVNLWRQYQVNENGGVLGEAFFHWFWYTYLPGMEGERLYVVASCFIRKSGTYQDVDFLAQRARQTCMTWRP